MQKFEMPITAPLGVREQKNFGFPSFSLGGTSTPKMIKIGELVVLSYLDLPWNEPYNFKAFLSSFSSHFYMVEATNFCLVSIERYLRVVSIPYIINYITRLFVGQSLYIFIRLGAMTQNRHSYVSNKNLIFVR